MITLKNNNKNSTNKAKPCTVQHDKTAYKSHDEE